MDFVPSFGDHFSVDRVLMISVANVSIFPKIQFSYGMMHYILDHWHIGRYLKRGVLESIVYVIKHANFKLYRAYSDRII